MRRVLKVFAGVVVLTALIVVYLMKFHGLRIERDGTGIWPIVSFYNPEQHLKAIEQNQAPAPVVEPAPPTPVATPEAPPAPVEKPYWTDFRGPRRDGRYDEMPILTKWPAAGPQRLWRKPIGGGYASFVIANGKAFTIEQRRNQEVVAAYDMATGRQVWANAWDAFFQEYQGGNGPRATPTWHDGRVYALGAEGELRCLDDKTGRVIWSKNILSDNGASNLQWGMTAAPLIVDNTVVVQPGPVVAYNNATGEKLWSALSDKAAYTSPMLVMLAGERQIVTITATRTVGLTTSGKLLWEYPWATEYGINASQPVITGPDTFILSAGYGHGAALVRITPSGPTTVWQNTRMKNKFTSSVLHEGHIYGLDESILACINAETGDLKWKGGRYGYGQLVLASGHLIITTEDGDIALVRATPEKHEELVRFPAIEGKTWNHPVISGGVLLVRNTTEMAAFRIH